MTQNYKTEKSVKTIRNAMLGLAAAAIIGTSACAPAQSSYPINSDLQVPQGYMVVKGQPLGVSSNCYGEYSGICTLSVALQNADGSISNITTNNTGWNMNEITALDAAIQAEINDGDKESIEVILNEGWDIVQATVERVTY